MAKRSKSRKGVVMRKIRAYTLNRNDTDYQYLYIPKDAKFLSCYIQNCDDIELQFEINEKSAIESIVFFVLPNDVDFGNYPASIEHVHTIISGSRIFHIYKQT